MGGKRLDWLAHVCKKNRIINTAAQYLYLNVMPALFSRTELKNRAGDSDSNGVWGRGTVRVAFVCDEMTWLDFRDCCHSLFLSPLMWREQFAQFQPQVFFCESAWEGSMCGWPDWRGRIYRNREVFFENRKILLEILEYCRQAGIPTVFWNKEDPPRFHQRYDFIDTALRFDWIFTTAAECVSVYQARGHQRVFLLPFGVNTDIFYPRTPVSEPKRILFAGSWFSDMPQRCQDMCMLFDYVLSSGMTLDIYDRKSSSGGDAFRFPERYRPYIHHSVPYERLPELFSKYEYAINVNSVTDSRTMCSRRVLQMAACGMKIISNFSPAMFEVDGLNFWKSAGDGRIFYFESDPTQIAAQYATYRQFPALLEQVLGPTAVPPEKKAGAVRL